VSCSTKSILPLARTIPVKPPAVNKKINPKTQANAISTLREIPMPCKVVNQLKIFTPVGMAISIVTLVK
jgi:hypothetical protein